MKYVQRDEKIPKLPLIKKNGPLTCYAPLFRHMNSWRRAVRVVLARITVKTSSSLSYALPPSYVQAPKLTYMSIPEIHKLIPRVNYPRRKSGASPVHASWIDQRVIGRTRTCLHVHRRMNGVLVQLGLQVRMVRLFPTLCPGYTQH